LGKKIVESKRFQNAGFPASAWNAGKAMSQAKRVLKSAFTGPLAGAKKVPSTALAEDHPQIKAIECYVRLVHVGEVTRLPVEILTNLRESAVTLGL
jgi:hypothetical protein